MNNVTIALLALAVGASACKKKSSDKPNAGSQSEPVVELEAKVNAEEGEAFAKELTSYVAKPCQGDKIESLFDFDRFIDRAVPSSIAGSQRSGVIAGIKSKQIAATSFCTGLPPEADMTFLRVQSVRGEPKPLYRRLLPDGSLSYVRLDLAKINGKVKMIDWSDFILGQRATEAIRDFVDEVANKGDMAAVANSAGALAQIRGQIRDQDFASARAAIATLPEGLKNKRLIRLLETMASQDLPPEQYSQALQKFETEFPEDPSLLMMQIDGYFLKEKWDELIAVTEKLSKTVGGDAHLSALIATAYMKRNKDKDLDHALELLKAAIAAEPKLEHPPTVLLDLQVARKDRKGLAEAIGLFFKATSKPLSRSGLAGLATEEMLRGPEFDALEKTGALVP